MINLSKVLIIDDSAFQRKMIKRIVIAGGYDIAEAVNGKDGLIKLEEFQPDCILLDLLMPEMNGFAFLSKIKELQIDVPIIIVSSDVQNSTQKKCLKLGVSNFLYKPPDESKLLKLIKNVIDKK